MTSEQVATQTGEYETVLQPVSEKLYDATCRNCTIVPTPERMT